MEIIQNPLTVEVDLESQKKIYRNHLRFARMDYQHGNTKEAIHQLGRAMERARVVLDIAPLDSWKDRRDWAEACLNVVMKESHESD